MIKPKLYVGQNLPGTWEITKKIDGVRAFISDKGVFSRNGKPLYNLDSFIIPGLEQDVEVFCGSFDETITKVRSQTPQEILPEHIFSLDPLDHRLRVGLIIDADPEQISDFLRQAIDQGHEGLVLRQNSQWLKVKPFETYDVRITGLIPGKGKYTGKLGAFQTNMGNVGTGLTNMQREEYNDPSLISTYIEIECMELTKDGIFRHPRFKRMRFDK